jgi:cytosine deaminase
VSLAVLPATDLFNAGRHMEHSVMRGVTDANTLIENGANCTISTNNVLNAFTPYGDCSLVRIVNLYANIVQRYGPKDLGVCFEMITDRRQVDAASRLRHPWGKGSGPGSVG